MTQQNEEFQQQIIKIHQKLDYFNGLVLEKDNKFQLQSQKIEQTIEQNQANLISGYQR